MIYDLFESAEKNLSPEEMKKMADCPLDMAENDASNISATLEMMAVLYANDTPDTQVCAPLNDQLAKILWGLSYRAKYISELIRISQNAQYEVNKAKEEQP